MTAPGGPAKGALMAALGCGMVGLLSQAVLPMLLGRLTVSGAISGPMVGLTLGAENIVITATTALASFFLAARHIRWIAWGAGLLLASASLYGSYDQTLDGILISRSLAGVAEGLLFWIALRGVAQFPIPERAGGILNLGGLALAFAASAALAQFILPRFDNPGGFVTLAGLSALALPLALLLPDSLDMSKEKDVSAPPSLRGWVALLVVVLFNAAGMGFVAYVVPLAARSGLDVQVADQTLAAMAAAQLVAAGVASLLAGRVRYGLALALSILGYAVTWPAYAMDLSAAGFIALGMSLGFITMFAIPFQFALAINADTSPRTVLLCGPALMLGATLGQLVAAQGVALLGLSGVLISAAIQLFLAACLLAGLWAKRMATQPIPQSQI